MLLENPNALVNRETLDQRLQLNRDMCGLNPSAGNGGPVGFRHARIAPKPDASLAWARARYRSAVGLYESCWALDDAGPLTVEIVIPFNAAAAVVLPDARLGDVTCDGQTLRDGAQVGSCVELTLGAGRYRLRQGEGLWHRLSSRCLAA